MRKGKLAQEDADYIINNLDKNEIVAHFPAKDFPKEQMEQIIEGIRTPGRS